MSNMTVCIVDDFRENAQYIERVLADYSTHVFDDPEAAYEFCSCNPFDVIVADQKMPKMTGIELVTRLRDLRQDFVALLISAYTDPEDLINAVNSNTIYKYVVKPFSPHVLLHHVNRAVEWLQTSERISGSRTSSCCRTAVCCRKTRRFVQDPSPFLMYLRAATPR